uniref:Inositol polyphosphate-4-phosphatase type II B n=2 Tax=Canis lupus familiaris TaxID=9615 RepID=A0A8P0TNG7_CANLF
MEIKEEGASEEGQHFLPTPQANDTGDFQFTSIQKTPNEPQLEFILGKSHISLTQEMHERWGVVLLKLFQTVLPGNDVL